MLDHASAQEKLESLTDDELNTEHDTVEQATDLKSVPLLNSTLFPQLPYRSAPEYSRYLRMHLRFRRYRAEEAS